MILVRGIGMSGYIPLEGVVGLHHSPVDYIFWDLDSCKRKCARVCQFKCNGRFIYLSAVESNRTTSQDILRRAVSFVVYKRFDASILSTLAKDVGLLSGYFCAGPLIPRNLFHLFFSDLGLKYYRDLAYIPYIPDSRYGEFVCSTVWAEYIRLDPDISTADYPIIYVEVLGYRKPFCDFRRDGSWM